MKKLIRNLVVLIFISTVSADSTINSPQCHCDMGLFGSHKHAVRCSNRNLHEIPRCLPVNLDYLDLSRNVLYEITQNAFINMSQQLTELDLKDSQIKEVHKDGFSGLAQMCLLYLSHNHLKTLHPDTFRETQKLEILMLNDNRIEMLEDGLFNNLQFLHKVYLENNKIVQIGIKTFVNVPQLGHLDLKNNKLKHLEVDTLSALTSLSVLNIEDNPWHCDLHLQPFISWVLSIENTYALCDEPENIHGKLWLQLVSSDFALKPTIMYYSPNTTIQTSDTNISLSCRVDGYPLTEINWVFDNETIKGNSKYYVKQMEIEQNSKWVNLTILYADETDSGEYFCIAKNSAGDDERSLTLVVNPSRAKEALQLQEKDLQTEIIVGLSLSSVAIFVIICWYCKRRCLLKKKVNTNGVESSGITNRSPNLVNPMTESSRIQTVTTRMSRLNEALPCYVPMHPHRPLPPLPVPLRPRRSLPPLPDAEPEYETID